MYLVGSSIAENRPNIPGFERKLDCTKWTTTIIRSLTLVAFSVLLLISPSLSHAQSEVALYNFPGTIADGFGPESNLTSYNGNFYGTTIYGGTYDAGTVFELSPSSTGGWNETVLYSFTGGGDGGYPTYSNVVFDSVGNLYGTAYQGGHNDYGVVFELSPVGDSWSETVIYNFLNGSDAAYPINGLIMDSAGNLYGSSYLGGGGNGAVFEVSPSSSGWTEQVIYELSTSYAGLTMDTSGNIYGVTYQSQVFELSPNGDGGWTPTIIHTFTGAPTDGNVPQGTPVFHAGNLYGTTTTGGTKNFGTVYELIPGKKGVWTEKLLHSFAGATKDGNEPWAGVTFDSAGNIYGTTLTGGKSGLGTVYELVAPASGSTYTEKVLWSFTGVDGNGPYSSPLVENALVYGTTFTGGSEGDGVFFEVDPAATATKTTLSSSPKTAPYGATVTFTAVVSPAPPDGETVSFMVGTSVLGTGTLSGGSASFETFSLPVGTTKLTATYSGDLKFDPSTSTALSEVVTKASTSTTLSSSANPSTSGELVTFTAMVVSSTGTPSGTVTFKAGSTTLGTETLSDGTASFSTAGLAVGTNSITAVYAGNTDYATSKSPVLNQKVSQ